MALLMQLVRPLLITIFLEGLTAWILGIRDKRGLLVVVLVNVITNVTLNTTLIILNLKVPYDIVRIVVWILEALVVVVEGFIFRSFLEKIKHPFLFSLCLNAVSYFLGSWLERLILMIW